MPGSNSGTWGRFCDGLGSFIMVQYSVGPIITLHGQITARDYVDRLGNQVHPMIQTFRTMTQFSKMTAGTVQSKFEEHEGELQNLPWPAKLADLNITEPLWPVLETIVRNRFPRPTSLKQPEDVLQEWYRIQLETVQNLYKSIPQRIAAVLRAKGGPTSY
jgi:hypothetical protein